MYRHNTHGVGLLQNISTGLGLFWDDLPQQQNISPTHFHSNLGFLEKKILCKAPYYDYCYYWYYYYVYFAK